MNELLEIERIKRLKYKYFRALDTNQWDVIAETFMPDCTAAYDSGKYSYNGRDAIVEFLSKGMSSPNMITLHQAHHPEIDLLDDATATGIWYLQDIVIHTEENWVLRGAGFYRDRYVKDGGVWKHSHIGYDRTYEEIETRGDTVQVTNSMFSREGGRSTGVV
jgi:hypothetical protein